MSSGVNFTCPYCNQPTTITEPNIDERAVAIDIAATHMTFGSRACVQYVAIACPNQKCKQLTLMLELRKCDVGQYNTVTPQELIQAWRLLPEPNGKPQPDYIPRVIVDDYREACRIRDLSPKASATLSRRCLQGMIRDYWKISKKKLFDEIEALEEHVTPETWGAIDAVRSVGNIGAHMEQDVNVIVDIEPEEADLLIKLIEDLFVDWYVTRHDREERQRKIKELATRKEVAKKA